MSDDNVKPRPGSIVRPGERFNDACYVMARPWDPSCDIEGNFWAVELRCHARTTWSGLVTAMSHKDDDVNAYWCLVLWSTGVLGWSHTHDVKTVKR